MDRRADLHIHTKYSDGSLDPKDVVRLASERGVSCISITDHDSICGIDQAISAGNVYHVEIIPGVEISAEESGKEVHILGYCINYRDRKLLHFLEKIRQDRIERLYKMAGLFKDHGIEIDVKELIKFAGDVSVSRLHVAKYMYKEGLVSSWREAFRKYIGDQKPCYVGSFRYSPKNVIEAIKQAGGVSVIAHPGVNNLDDMLPAFIDDGLDGIEAFHSEHSEGKSRHYESFAKMNNLLITGGSDCHGDLKEEILIGRTTIPYFYVEALKSVSRKGR